MGKLTGRSLQVRNRSRFLEKAA